MPDKKQFRTGDLGV